MKERNVSINKFTNQGLYCQDSFTKFLEISNGKNTAAIITRKANSKLNGKFNKVVDIIFVGRTERFTTLNQRNQKSK